MTSYKTKYTSIEIHVERVKSDPKYKGYFLLTALGVENAEFFMECYEHRLLNKCKELFPMGDARGGESGWEILINIKDYANKIQLPDLIGFVKDLESDFSSKIKEF